LRFLGCLACRVGRENLPSSSLFLFPCTHAICDTCATTVLHRVLDYPVRCSFCGSCVRRAYVSSAGPGIIGCGHEIPYITIPLFHRGLIQDPEALLALDNEEAREFVRHGPVFVSHYC
jgi:hypothetical protein